jgi:hypothetical protein
VWICDTMGLQLPPKTRLGDENNACGSFWFLWKVGGYFM